MIAVALMTLGAAGMLLGVYIGAAAVTPPTKHRKHGKK